MAFPTNYKNTQKCHIWHNSSSRNVIFSKKNTSLQVRFMLTVQMFSASGGFIFGVSVPLSNTIKIPEFEENQLWLWHSNIQKFAHDQPAIFPFLSHFWSKTAPDFHILCFPDTVRFYSWIGIEWCIRCCMWLQFSSSCYNFRRVCTFAWISQGEKLEKNKNQ